MDGGTYDWTAFATGFLAALLIIFVIRWRRGTPSRKDLSAPPRFVPPITDLSPDLRAQILLLKAEGHRIEAIKLARERTGMGLAEAKQLVDEVR